jgi:acetate kinase
MENLLNKESGYIGISGISSDARDLEEALLRGEKRAQLTQNINRYQIKKYIGAYAAAMDGLDALVFTGGKKRKPWIKPWLLLYIKEGIEK